MIFLRDTSDVNEIGTKSCEEVVLDPKKHTKAKIVLQLATKFKIACDQIFGFVSFWQL
jgi:hypothetical protein